MGTFVFCSHECDSICNFLQFSHSTQQTDSEISYGKCDSGISGMNLNMIYVVRFFVLRLKGLCNTQMERVLNHFPQVLYA